MSGCINCKNYINELRSQTGSLTPDEVTRCKKGKSVQNLKGFPFNSIPRNCNNWEPVKTEIPSLIPRY